MIEFVGIGAETLLLMLLALAVAYTGRELVFVGHAQNMNVYVQFCEVLRYISSFELGFYSSADGIVCRIKPLQEVDCA